jgi:di/tricarboxylate transporter
LFEAVVSNTSPLAGKTIRDGRFRNRYQAVVLAVARNGERVRGKIGDIKLRAGDVLLTDWMSMLIASALAALLIVLTRCCTVSEARESVDWSVLIAIGAALGLGRAIETSGAGQLVADAVLALAEGNPLAALAQATAEQLDVSFLPFVMAVMIAGSAGFATPFGYQTNLMVYGPGGYRFSDYVRFGAPLDVIVGIVALLVIPWVWPL